VVTSAIRWGGVALVAGAVALGVALAALSVARTQPVGTGAQYAAWVGWLLAAGALLILLALPPMYAHQARESGMLGLIGFLLLQAGWVLAVVVTTAPLVYEGLPSEPGESVAALALGTMLAAGFVLTSIATTRAGVYPAWTGWVLVAAAAGFAFLFFVAEFLPAMASRVGGLLFGLLVSVGWAAMGVTMWTRR
jgi:hypothetical protein